MKRGQQVYHFGWPFSITWWRLDDPSLWQTPLSKPQTKGFKRKTRDLKRRVRGGSKCYCSRWPSSVAGKQ
jgi:hypothetical protein